jgi:hypothetical protein
MPERLVGVLESYDFFGKSIPGIVALIGVVTLSPTVPLVSLDEGTQINLPILLALSLTLVFAGLVFGQVFHTIADNIEKITYRLGHWAYNRYYVQGPLISDDWLEDHSNIYWIFNYCKPWLERRYWGLHDSFKSHRRLFENEIGWYFDISVDKRRSHTQNINYDLFRESCQDKLDVDIAKFDRTKDDRLLIGQYENIRQLYPMVATIATSEGTGRAQGFQARYSFCRGMWVVLLLLNFSYLAILYSPVTPQVFSYKPVILQVLSKGELGLLIWSVLLLILAFMDAAGDYKMHYVEYLVTEFNAS